MVAAIMIMIVIAGSRIGAGSASVYLILRTADDETCSHLLIVDIIDYGLAQQLRIQSIPTVYAFFQGRPVDGFQGALPESEVKAFVKRLTDMGGGGDQAAAIEQALEEAEAALGKGDGRTAAAIFGQVLEVEPENLKAISGMLRAMIAAGDTAQAAQQYETLPPEIKEWVK